MQTFTKIQVTGLILLLLCFTLTTCGELPEKHVKTLSGNIFANEYGNILFRTLNGVGPIIITFTTDLPEPNNQFVMEYTNSFFESSLKTKSISSLTPGQKVRWKATSSSYYIQQKTKGNTVEVQSYLLIEY